jgi:NAD(P)H-quinone oxidoreductase subunit 5
VVWVFNGRRSLTTSWFYKAYLFLSAGGNRAFETAKPTPIKIKPVQVVIVLWDSRCFSIAYLTGKGTELNSSIFLTLIVAITVGQATYNIVKEQSLSLSKIILPPFCLFVVW